MTLRQRLALRYDRLIFLLRERLIARLDRLLSDLEVENRSLRAPGLDRAEIAELEAADASQIAALDRAICDCNQCKAAAN
jgi:hypothetical protein